MPGADTRVMYLVLRSDLMKVLKWPLGAVVAQGAHAATACIWSYKEDADVIEYMRDANHMRKVALQVEDEHELKSIEKVLTDNNIDYRLWVEDNMPVCIAVKPQPRNIVHKHLRHLRLYA